MHVSTCACMFVVVCDVYDVYNVQVYVCVYIRTHLYTNARTRSPSLSLFLSLARARALSHTQTNTQLKNCWQNGGKKDNQEGATGQAEVSMSGVLRRLKRLHV